MKHIIIYFIYVLSDMVGMLSVVSSDCPNTNQRENGKYSSDNFSLKSGGGKK